MYHNLLNQTTPQYLFKFKLLYLSELKETLKLSKN